MTWSEIKKAVEDAALLTRTKSQSFNVRRMTETRLFTSSNSERRRTCFNESHTHQVHHSWNHKRYVSFSRHAGSTS